jgi:hypothetical protein
VIVDGVVIIKSAKQREVPPVDGVTVGRGQVLQR